MKNKHIELVNKWLADKDSVSQEELKANADAAWAARHQQPFPAFLQRRSRAVADAAYGAYTAAAARAADAAAYVSAAYASAAADAAYAADAANWVKKYEETTNDK